jgi:hypothetical protein
MKNANKNSKNTNIQEGCGCEKKKLVKNIKNKYANEQITEYTDHYTPKQEKTVDCFSKFNFVPFLDKKVLFETNTGSMKGTLRTAKNKYAIFENDKFKILDLKNITKFVCEGLKVTVSHTDNLMNVLDELVTPSPLAESDEKFKLLLKEKINNLFFVKEEIVNPDHKGKLTKDRQISRDGIAKKLKNVKVVKGPKGRNDTPEEAKYRLATYIEFQKDKNQKEKTK